MLLPVPPFCARIAIVFMAAIATSAAAHGVEERKIMDQTGHKSVTMVRKYIREGELFRGNAAGRVGL